MRTEGRARRQSTGAAESNAPLDTLGICALERQGSLAARQHPAQRVADSRDGHRLSQALLAAKTGTMHGVWRDRFSIVALKLVFEQIDVPLFEAFGAELGAKQADGAVLERKSALVAAGGVPRPLFRSPIRMIDHAHRDTLDFRRCRERSTDWLDPERAEPLVLPAFLKRWILRPRRPRSVPGSAPTEPGSASGVRERSS